MASVVLVTAVASMQHDGDLAALAHACAELGLDASVRAWDDPTVGWGRFDAAVLRSPWDYITRHPEFLDWCTRVEQRCALFNPMSVVRWNSDKHYLADLAAHGVPVIPTTYVEPDAESLPALAAFLATQDAPEFVVKPAIGAGSCDTQRYARSQDFAASNHIARLLDEGRSVVLQPYLDSVDIDGETALVWLDGHCSHAIRKAPLLGRDGSVHRAGADSVTAREPAEDELAVARRALEAAQALLQLEGPLAYARVDLIRDAQGQPRLLELELVEPALFLDTAPGSHQRLARCLADRVNGISVRARTEAG